MLYNLQKKESKTSEILVEKYMGKSQDLVCVLFVSNGNIDLIKLGDRYLGNPNDNLDRQVMLTYFPSLFSSVFVTNVYPKLVKFVKALEINYGCVFFQGFIDGDTVSFMTLH